MPPHLALHLERIEAEQERLRELLSLPSFDAETACVSLRESGDKTELRVHALEEALRDAREQPAALAPEVQEAKDAVAALASDMREVREQLATLAAEVRQAREKIATFASDIQDLRNLKEAVRSLEAQQRDAARTEKTKDIPQEELERAAAAAAARIIREELAAVLKDV
jgi:chromosome segregation ATPase